MIIEAEQIRIGDIVEQHGVRHVVSAVRRPAGASWPIACDGTGWGIALGHQPIEVRCLRASARQLAA